MRRRWPLTLRGSGAAVLAVASLVIAQRAGIPELMYFGVLMAALLAAAAVTLLIARRTDRVTRTVRPDVIDVGSRTDVVVRVGLQTALPTAPGRWADALPAGVSGNARGLFPATASSLGRDTVPVELRYEIVGRERGVHALGPLEVVTTDPFGLVRRRFKLGRPSPITVAPAIVDLPPLPPTGGEAGGTRQSSALQLGEGVDNLVARPYAPGDSMRRIHWRATAHRDTLMVRQEEQESSPAATVVLDRAPSRWSAAAGEAPSADIAFETAVSACVSAVARLVHEGYTVDVVDSDGELLAEPVDGGEEGEARALAASFAGLTARVDGSSARVIPASAAVMMGPVVVVTSDPSRDPALVPGAFAQRSALPIMVVVAPQPDLDAPLAAGWRVASVRPGGDIAAAWADATERGLADVGR
ncbi:MULTISPECIES: DUF58 domain-containing protein [Microbacterium]|uniref:DUF58 domain-containing protein n=1 Tax=Microbacterium TaxID=33882 RepID=UPI002782B7C0|nr:MULTISPECIES: DUF58 domain-containing protein [Microbacterium]MDQ1076111.1 uncharacterized protein (DUF58 family) [Microbacterium sp. SORGH_AS_0969]MDQ1116350.1 uncharacterized protein (DUF58 family) [Microbacterium testaceum]